MQGKGLIYFFTSALLAVVIYQFLLVIPIRGVESDADDFAAQVASKYKDDAEEAAIQRDRARQAYLDSMGSEKINFLFMEYSYQQLKKQQLAYGLDLQGGMSVVLQVDVRDLIIFLSADNPDPIFRNALQKARELQIRGGQGTDFVTLFGQEFQKLASGRPLSSVFLTAGRLTNVTLNSSDADVLSAIREKATESVGITYQRLKERIDRFGVAQPVVSLDPQTDRITVELPGITNPARAREYLQATASLEFWELYPNTDVVNSLARLDESLKKKGSSAEKPSTDTAVVEKPTTDTSATASTDTSNTAQPTTDTGKVAETPATPEGADETGPLFKIFTPFADGSAAIGVARKWDTAKVNAFIQGEGQRFLPKDARFAWSAKHSSGNNNERVFMLYALRTKGRKEAPIQGERIVRAKGEPDERGRHVVSLTMDSEGSREWKAMTERNVGKQVAVVLDNKVYSAPVVNGVIPNGQTQISGDFTASDAADLATILSVGKLPARTEIIEEAIVGPSLGEATVNAGFFALIAGLVLVILFMLGYYSASGAVSLLTLALNIFFIVGCLASLGTVLTLAGIAGIVLTIGMAVDANVIIFERAREELRRGLPWNEAIVKGFGHSYSAIIDSNITTLATALVLFYFGLGPIKGFATVLIVGVVSSVFTAVLVGRVIFDYFVVNGKTVALGLGATQNVLASPTFDILSKRKIAYAFSAVVILAGVASMFTRGFELGVDLTGGRTYTVAFSKPVDVEAFKPVLAKAFEGYDRNLVKTFNESNQIKITTSYKQDNTDEAVNVDELIAKQLYQAAKDYAAESAGNTTYEQFVKGRPEGTEAATTGFYLNASNKVGPTIADDIKQSAFSTSFIALALIFTYILLRFRRWQYSAGAVVALAHDVLFILSIFSLLHGILPMSLEIDQSFVAALLTIIGYSINDTMIVFDRVREETKDVETSEQSFGQLVNQAINSTLSRTMITSLTTLFVVLLLFLFGGDGIRGFSFALLIGILVGTYSSIFIASPFLVDTVKDIASIREEDVVIADLPGLGSANEGEETIGLLGEEQPKKD